MLSQLSRGYGSWVAGYVDPSFGEKKGHHDREHTLPEIDQESHCHGITVGTRSGRSTSMSYATTKKTKDTSATDTQPLPKTYTTRKGALQLYVAPFSEAHSSDDEENDRYMLQPKYAQIKRPAGQELIDLSLKLGTMGRLACSVLNFGDEDYDKEHASVSESKNKAFLKFLRSIDDPSIPDAYNAETLRPGGDLNTYLQELRSSSSLRNYGSSNTYIPKNREFLELQALLRGLDNNSWPLSYQQDGLNDRQSSGQFTRPVSRVSSQGETPGPPSTPKSSYKVLSSKQLTASLKSSSYLGRPSSQFSAHDDDDVQSDIDHSLRNVTSASFNRKPWTPDSSTDELLIDKYFKGSNEDWETEEGNKRRRFKERSLVMGSENLYQGRNSHNGEVYHNDLKFKGEGFTPLKGQTMNQINEEMQPEDTYSKYEVECNDEEMSEEESDANGQWAEHVTRVQQTVTTITDEKDGSKLPDDKKDVATLSRYIEMPLVQDSDKESKFSGPRSTVSDTSMSSMSSLKHKPAVVTLQSFNTPKQTTPSDRNGLLFKRRKSLSAAVAFDPERLRNAIQGPRRRPQSSHAEKTHPFLMKGESKEDNVSKQVGSKYSYTPTMTYWSATEIDTPLANPNEIHVCTTNDTKCDIDESGCLRLESSKLDLDTYHDKVDANDIYKDYDAGVIEEDALLKDIKECNEEVEQIEGNTESVASADTDSDSGTFVDEEIIRELIEAEENEKPLISGECVPVNHVSMKVDDTKEESPESSVKCDVTREEGHKAPNIAAENEKKDYNEIEVDEVHDERLSDIPSKSSRILPSKVSSKLSSADMESMDENDDGSSDFQKDIEGPEDAKIILDDQTCFSGSTGSYSDLLANDRSISSLMSLKDRDTKEPGAAFAFGERDMENKQKLIEANTVDTEILNLDGVGGDINRTFENVEDESVNRMKGITEEDEAHDEHIDKKGDSETKPILGGEQEDNVVANNCRNKITDKQEELDIVSKTANNERRVSNDVTEIEIATAFITNEDAIIKAEEDKIKIEYDVYEQPNTEDILKRKDIRRDDNKKAAKVEVRRQHVQKASSKPPITVKPTIKSADAKTTKPSIRKTTGAIENVDRTNSKLTHDNTVAAFDTDRIEGSNMVDAKSEVISSLTEIGEGILVTHAFDDDLNQGPDAGTTAPSIADELDALGLNMNSSSGKKKPKKTDYPLLPPGKRPKAPPEKMKIPDHLKEAMDRKMVKSYESLEKDLERMTAIVDDSLSSTTLEAVGEGLTEEELEMAKQILQRKIEEAKLQLDGKDTKSKGQKKKAQVTKGPKKGKRKKEEDDKSEEDLQKAAIKEKQALEKKRRDEEVKELQRKIAERRLLLQSQDDEASAKAKELRDQMEKLEQEADDLQRAEDEARDILSEVRKKQREERDARRKADAERRKQDALDRREKEKKDQEEKRRKEMEMMEKIADAEMRRRLRDDEERKMYEEERLAQERYEEELREAQRMEEEEEERMRELERQAEEEAMQRLIDEREAAERQRRRLLEEEENMIEIERQKREIMMQEEERLADEKRKIEEQEQKRREKDMERLMELRRAEEEARQKLNDELEKRRSEALGRRDYNLENKQHVDKLRHYQGITRAWTFSYFIKWPRETYERPIGDPDPRKVVKIKNPAPKKAETQQANTDNPTELPPQ